MKNHLFSWAEGVRGDLVYREGEEGRDEQLFNHRTACVTMKQLTLAVLFLVAKGVLIGLYSKGQPHFLITLLAAVPVSAQDIPPRVRS